MQRLKTALVCLLLLALTAGMIQIILTLRALTTAAQALPGTIQIEFQQTRAQLLLEVDEQATGIRGDAVTQIAILRRETLKRVDSLSEMTDRRLGDSLKRIDAAETTLSGIRDDLAPVLANAATLEANYAALPRQLGDVLKPSWAKLEPEMTCVQPDGTGYGGCWHARITALLGESARAGGIFVQHFPIMADSLTGIAGNFNHMTGEVDRKYFPPPHKLTAKEAAADVGRIALLISVALIRAGAL